jgi:hypothetical protein
MDTSQSILFDLRARKSESPAKRRAAVAEEAGSMEKLLDSRRPAIIPRSKTKAGALGMIWCFGSILTER